MYHSGGAKLEMPVEYPLRLEASSISPAPEDAHPLHLAAIVCHFGSKAYQQGVVHGIASLGVTFLSALQGGHYTAYVRHPSTGTWLYCNDSQISEVSYSCSFSMIYITPYLGTTCITCFS